MRSNDDIYWPVHSLILSFHDLCDLLCDDYHPASTVPCSMIFGNELWRRHGWTMIACDAWEQLLLTSGKDIDMLPRIFVCFMLSVWYAKYYPVTFAFNGMNSPLQILWWTLMKVYSASSTASPAKHSFSDGCWGVKAFCIILLHFNQIWSKLVNTGQNSYKK